MTEIEIFEFIRFEAEYILYTLKTVGKFYL